MPRKVLTEIFFSPQKVTTKFLIPKGKFALHHAKLFLSIAIELSYKYRYWLSSVFIVFIGSRSKQQDPGPHGHKNVISQEAIWLHCFATAPAVSTLFQFSGPYLVNIAIFWAFFSTPLFNWKAFRRQHDGRGVDVRKFDEMGRLLWWNSSRMSSFFHVLFVNWRHHNLVKNLLSYSCAHIVILPSEV